MIKVEVTSKQTIQGLNRLGRSQIPFAVAKSLTDLAKKSQKGIRKNTVKKFDIRAKKFIERGIKIKPAKKSQIKMFSEVFATDKIDFMLDHEDGAIRLPKSSKVHSVPTIQLQVKKYRTASGKVRKRFKPATLLKQFNQTRGPRGSSPRTRSKKAFIIKGRGNIPLVVRRLTKKRKPLDVLYHFQPRVKIDKRWGFEKTVRGIVNNNYQRIFERNLNQAIATAR